jgi:Zn-finger domain-containing protein
MNNRLPALQRRARTYLKNLVVAYDYKTQAGADLINVKLGVFAPVNMNLFNLATNYKYRWNIILIAVGLNGKAKQAYSTIELETTERFKQSEMTQYINDKMEQFKKQKHDDIQTLTNTAWIASPQRLDITDTQIDRILRLRGAW